MLLPPAELLTEFLGRESDQRRVERHEGQVEEQRLGLVVAADDGGSLLCREDSLAVVHLTAHLGVHVGGEHVLVVRGDALVPAEVVPHLVAAELDAGAGDHPALHWVKTTSPAPGPGHLLR